MLTKKDHGRVQLLKGIEKNMVEQMKKTHLNIPSKIRNDPALCYHEALYCCTVLLDFASGQAGRGES